LQGLPFVADRGYDAIDILEKLSKMGSELAAEMKETMRKEIKHSIRKLSKGNWEKYGRD